MSSLLFLIRHCLYLALVSGHKSREKKLKEKRSQSFSKKCSVVTWVVTDN